MFASRTYRPGRWLGKCIRKGDSVGYNVFSSNGKPPASIESKVKGMPSDRQHARPFKFTLAAPSVFDGSDSSIIDYGADMGNGPLFGNMRDEVREVAVVELAVKVEHFLRGVGYFVLFVLTSKMYRARRMSESLYALVLCFDSCVRIRTGRFGR